MKKLMIRIFVELYYWQEENWGENSAPAFGALLVLSALQFLNALSFMMAIENVTSIGLSDFFINHLAVGMLVPIGILIGDYLMIKPIAVTLKDNSLKKPRITWIYVLLTLILLGACIAWIVYNNK